MALRLTQALNAVAMSLAAVPVFLLARRLDLAKGFALAAAVLAVLVPDLFYVAYILAEPIAYPLVLGAIYVGVRALDRPTRWNQVGFVALAGLATFARIQFIVLPIAFVLAALVARTGLRRLKLTFGLFALAAIPVAAKGVGYYSGIADFHVDPGALLHWFAVDSMLLAYAAGWLVIPGALVVLARPRPGVERAFAALTVCFAAGLFLEAVLFATNADRAPGGRFQERYLFTLIPLLLLAFGLSLGRGGRVRGAVALIAAVLVAVSARFPLAGWVDDHGRQDSPLLMGVYRLSEGVGYANASFLAAAAVAVLAGSAVARRLPASVRHAGARRDGRPARARRLRRLVAGLALRAAGAGDVLPCRRRLDRQRERRRRHPREHPRLAARAAARADVLEPLGRPARQAPRRRRPGQVLGAPRHHPQGRGAARRGPAAPARAPAQRVRRDRRAHAARGASPRTASSSSGGRSARRG